MLHALGCDSLIRRNTARRNKTIVCGKGLSHVGSKIYVMECRSALVEAAHIATCIQKLLTNDCGYHAHEIVRNFSLFWTILFLILNDL